MMLRTFIAVEIPSDIQQSIARASQVIRKSLPVSLIRWVAPQNIHLTLKFLGDITPAAVNGLLSALEQEALRHSALDVRVAGFGAYPSPSRARVLWVGLQASSSLLDLYKGVENVTHQLTLDNRDSRFSPHLTIGRVNRNSSSSDLRLIASNLQQAGNQNLGDFRIDKIMIVKSDLRPSGPIYTPLHSIPLKPS